MTSSMTSFTVNIPSDIWQEIEELREQRGDSIDGLVTEALRIYLKECEWQSLLAYGEQRSRELGIANFDVEQLIDEFRREQR